MNRHKLDPQAAKAFVHGGDAIFTLVSTRTGTRYTYRLQQAQATERYPVPVSFAKVLTGPDNEASYTTFGIVAADGTYRHWRRSQLGEDAPSVRAFVWFYERLQAGTLPAGLEVYHEGRCGRCGRTLTVPESIDSGFGPDCRGMLAAAA